MRTLIWIAATITIAGCAFGQRGGGHPSGAPHGYSRPGTGRVPIQGRGVYIPYTVPYYDPFYSGYAGGYGAPYYPAAPYDPNAASYYPGSQYDGGAPAVVINQNFQPDTLHPVLNDYSNVPLPPPGAVQTPPSAAGAPNVQQLNQSGAQPLGGAPLRDDQPTIFLIAMKDHTIYPVIAYWVDGDTLNYVTVETVVKRVPLDQVDRDLSRQLNDQRNVEFKLPSR